MLFARVNDVTSSYEMSFTIAAFLFVLGAIVLPALGRYPRFGTGDAS
jgi:hypothetical protein